MDRLIEIGEEEMWTDYLEEVNKLLHDEKAARHENDAVKLSTICKRIVSHFINILLNFRWSSASTRRSTSGSGSS